MIIKIAKDFTETPGGRNKEQSKFSGEEFREDYLIPILRKCIKEKDNLVVDLDGTYGYATSFLDESFGKLVKYFTDEELKILSFISNDEPSLVDKICGYMENNRG